MSQILKHIQIPGQTEKLDIATSNTLTFSGSSKSFDGSEAVKIGPGDLGLSQALKFVGQTTSTLTDSVTTSPIVINGNNYTPSIGDVVLDSAGNGEFVWLGSYWEALGSENSYLLKTGGEVTGDLTLSGAKVTLNNSSGVFNSKYFHYFNGATHLQAATDIKSSFTFETGSTLIANSAAIYGTTLPSGGTKGQIFFKLVT